MTKADYQRKIWTYRKRRDGIKERCRNLTKKINQWENEIRRIDYKRKELTAIRNLVNKYFDLNIANKTTSPEYNLARNIYYKIAIESKIQGKIVSEFIGRKKKTAGECRLNFTRNFNKNKISKEAYHNFKKYFDNQ